MFSPNCSVKSAALRYSNRSGLSAAPRASPRFRRQPLHLLSTVSLLCLQFVRSRAQSGCKGAAITRARLAHALIEFNAVVHLRPMRPHAVLAAASNRPGLLFGLTRVLAQHEANITSVDIVQHD